jgi:hypothetical protein
MFRFPTRLFTTLVTFLAAIGAAFGVAAVVRLARARWRAVVEATALVVVLAVLVPRMRNDGVLPWTTRDPHILHGMAPLFTFLTAVDGDMRTLLGAKLGDWGVTARLGMVYGLRTLGDYEPLSANRLGDYLAAVQGLHTVHGNPFRPFVGWVRFDGSMRHPALLDLLAVRHVVFPAETPAPTRTPPLVRLATIGPYAVWDNPHALSRAYLVERARFVEDRATALATLTDPGFDGRREAVVLGAPDDDLASADAAPARPARIVADGPERVTVEFETHRRALLVLADGFAPGWRVDVDGAPRRVLEVNHLVRGVVVGPGERRATFAYRAPGFVPGLVAATAAIALVACSAALGRRRGAARRGRRTRFASSSGVPPC